MSELTPITREEALLDGQDLTPITRQEMFIKHIYDASQEIPEPITREEWFLKKAAEGGGGGDITVVPLSVTDNGTYTAPTGKAYSPVSVSVPLPTNAHLATAITSQPVTDASDYPLPKVDVTVTDADKCEVIVTDDGVIVEDNEPYNYRQSAGGDTELDELIGGTVAWNQLIDTNTTEVTPTSGHKILTHIGGTWAISVSDGTAISVTGGTDMLFDLTLMFGSTIADYIYNLEQTTAGSGVAWLKEHFPKLFDDGYKAYNTGELVSVKTTAHETVGFNQWDEEWELGGISSADGSNQSATTLRTKGFIPILPNVTYYNRVANWGDENNFKTRFYDANKNYIGFYDADGRTILKNSTFVTPANAKYMRFQFSSAYDTTYNNDICINISDPQKNGTYEPYKKHSYPLSPVELRGIFKLDANNKLTCDGDSYRCDGQVKRRYGIVDLGTLDFAYSEVIFYVNMKDYVPKPKYQGGLICSPYINRAVSVSNPTDMSIFVSNSQEVPILRIADSRYTDAATFKTAMSGVYLVYELATPTEEWTSPFEKNQIVDAGGTEEYVDDRSVSVPVGHSTKYYHGKAYSKYFAQKSGVVSMADEGIMPMTPMYIEANGTIDAEYWK